ncbi:MAG: deoxyhypusine synthase [Deltaproteobacteria bacterium]|nr:MAG: deoxyhypusine synthase [Deltaproteobacteria bacterium]
MTKRAKLAPPPLAEGSADVAALIDTYFNAYNAGRLREACQLWAHMIDSGATIGLSLSGALTPAGLSSVITPLIESGFVDYISSTGANLYHDLHFDLGFDLYRGDARIASGAHDVDLRRDHIIRVYDVLFEADVLYKTDDWLYRVMTAPEFSGRMGTAELHYKIGKYALETARQTGAKPSILATCHALDVPVWSPSPGDSTIGLNVAAMQAANRRDPGQVPIVDPSLDVNAMAALVYDCKVAQGGTSGVVILGGGAPKNFLLQTEPQIQEILGLEEKGHDYFIQVTDARVDTGGLSGATPSEAVSWGKVDPTKLPDCVVAYSDTTIALPLMASYVLHKCKPREPRRLYRRVDEMSDALGRAYQSSPRFQRLMAQNAGPPTGGSR